MSQTILLTGAAGFIGYHVAQRLLGAGHAVVGVDNLCPYYDVGLKEARLARLEGQAGFTFLRGAIETPGLLADLMATHKPSAVIHLAAQAGVRHSIDAPRDYVQANLLGTFELLEAARAHPPAHMLLASTSSAYGANTVMPYAETHKAAHPMSFYAATKQATESMAHSYAHLYGLPTTMFRFFTVYGPWGRPDMAPNLFAQAICAGDPIRVHNNGDMQRDFTYVDDLVERLLALMEVVPGQTPVGAMDSLSPVAPFRVVNLGNGTPVALMAFISTLEAALGREAHKVFGPMQPGDMQATWADTRLQDALIGHRASTPLSEGLAAFAQWYRAYPW